ncbi:ferredoxin [Kitasatospora camelliae]|uniref:Ferredoxin n=1 Tax=Kitasatospora camelliae TaxID=3156397 RepID=A0AAU8JZP1_9ACTN
MDVIQAGIGIGIGAMVVGAGCLLWGMRFKDRGAYTPRPQPGQLYGAWDELAYWDPLPHARELCEENAIGGGRWEDRGRLNVPGPFYCGRTGGEGRGALFAPWHVLRDESGAEFVYRQPADPVELRAVVTAAWSDPAGGYAWDGDRRWTPESVRAWWAGRGGVRDWIGERLAEPEREAGERESLRDFAAYLDDGLEDDLRGYLFWLIEGREPGLYEELPKL